MIMPACESIDSNRIPPYPVRIYFTAIGQWELYGVAGAGQYNSFIKSERKPQGFPYKAAEETGFGGVLLMKDPNGDLKAYDLACPVEAKRDVRIYVDTESPVAVARCPKCNSTYDIYSYGGPLSGEAHDKHYGLQRYNARIEITPGRYASVTN